MIDSMIIFSRENCDYCERAKGLLMRKSIKFKVKSLENDYDGNKSKFREAIAEKMPEGQEFSTVPQIFMGKKYIGGYNELAQFIGEL